MTERPIDLTDHPNPMDHQRPTDDADLRKRLTALIDTFGQLLVELRALDQAARVASESLADLRREREARQEAKNGR